MANGSRRKGQFYPNEDLTYLFYNDLLHENADAVNQHWNHVGESARNQFYNHLGIDTGDSSIKQIMSVASELQSLAESEYKKEINVLSTYYGLDKGIAAQLNKKTYNATESAELYNDIMELINTIGGSKDELEHLLNMMKLDKQNKKQNAMGHKGSFSHLLHDYIVTNINTYFNSPEFEEIFSKFFIDKQPNKNINFEAVKTAINKDLELAIQRAIEQMSEKTTKSFGYSDEEVLAFQNFVQAIQGEGKSKLIQSIISQYNIDNTIKQLQKYYNTRHTKQGKLDKRKTKKGGIDIKFPPGTVGFVGEAVAQAKASAIAELMDSESATYVIRPAGAAGYNTDMFIVKAKGKTKQVLMEANIDIDAIAASTLTNLTVGSESLKVEAQEKVQAFYDKLVDKLGDNFGVIQETTKTYTLKHAEDGFRGTSYKAAGLKDLLTRTGNLPVYYAILNMDESAVLEPSDLELARQRLLPLFANLMFERPEVINPNSSDHTVYVFRLSSLILPLSFVLRKAAQSLYQLAREESGDSLIRIEIRKNSIQKMYGEDGDTQSDKTLNSRARWGIQIKEAERASKLTLTIKFMQKFASLLQGDLTNWIR